MGKWMAVLAFSVTVMVLVVDRGAANETVDAEDVVEPDSFAARGGTNRGSTQPDA